MIQFISLGLTDISMVLNDGCVLPWQLHVAAYVLCLSARSFEGYELNVKEQRREV